MERSEFEPIETLVKRILNQVETVINVGSNIGYYVCCVTQKKHVLHLTILTKFKIFI